MSMVRRCLGCSATYKVDEPACPECGSYAGEAEEEHDTAAKPKPTRRRKS